MFGYNRDAVTAQPPPLPRMSPPSRVPSRTIMKPSRTLLGSRQSSNLQRKPSVEKTVHEETQTQTQIGSGHYTLTKPKREKRQKSAHPLPTGKAIFAALSKVEEAEKRAGEAVICEGLKNDPDLQTLCTSIGLGLHPETYVGPVEKGQLIIGVLQQSLNELIRMKSRKAEKKGETFHISECGLDEAIRALEIADRSLKTMRQGEKQIFRRNVRISPVQQQTTEAVIKILKTTKDKFDKMGNELGKFMIGFNFMAKRTPGADVTTGISLTTLPPLTQFPNDAEINNNVREQSGNKITSILI